MIKYTIIFTIWLLNAITPFFNEVMPFSTKMAISTGWFSTIILGATVVFMEKTIRSIL